MQGAVDIPGLDALTLAEFARGGEATVLALKREGNQGREPCKPLGRIGHEGKNALSWCNEHVVPISPIFNKRKCTRTSSGAVASSLGWSCSCSGLRWSCNSRRGRRGNRDGFWG